MLSSKDPRFGGFSGLALDRGRLLALTDQGSVAWLPWPDSADKRMLIRQLPDGPYSREYTWYRDTEALSRDPQGRGWWVSFEKANELWLYDLALRRALKRVRLGLYRWPTNLGIEGLVARPGPELLMFPEAEPRMFAMRRGRGVAQGLAGGQLKVSEAAMLPGGKVIALERDLSLGFSNRLVWLQESPHGWRVVRRLQLPAGLLDNLEGMTVQPLPNGSNRLWMISDDNFQRPLRTLLIAVDLPPERQGA
ncbi:esterase-like activity of phytase family protein [Sphingomonas piscis]|uniref:Esterase-like activity of phytase family protein n=1 Tax=Sphingomonas piscis TaxID=2714943 RepID=A0A6G7YQF6_9SPHN|nr:esterase-like activity of phytase family protein [Sphingomonas piscis]QIK78969.1 esterase-like activity of phytase family protein [Sphingomonas piscis]